MQCRELLRPQDAERLENLRTDLVLPAVAPGGRGQRGAETLAPIEHHQQPIVLIVGMRGRFHHDAGVGEMPQRQPERDVPLQFVNGRHPHLRGRHGKDQRGHCDRSQHYAFHNS